MVTWLGGGREQSRRIEALERELGSLRAKADLDARRVETLSGVVDSLAERVSMLAGAVSPLAARMDDDREDLARMRTSILKIMAVEAERAQGLSTTVGGLLDSVEVLRAAAGPERVSSLETAAKADREAMVKMRTAILRLERQLEIYFEESRKTGTALLERIETMRLG
jgi:chromosome segregation ATPase